MEIIGGLDLHRKQITFDNVNTETGELTRGKIMPATREELRDWLKQFAGMRCTFALEACTGWRFVVEEIHAAGHRALLAEPADTRALRGRKRRAKTDRVDARHLRELAQRDAVPQSWIPPEHIIELRAPTVSSPTSDGPGCDEFMHSCFIRGFCRSRTSSPKKARRPLPPRTYPKPVAKPWNLGFAV